jgi:hypothetical protein
VECSAFVLDPLAFEFCGFKLPSILSDFQLFSSIFRFTGPPQIALFTTLLFTIEKVRWKSNNQKTGSLTSLD